MPAVVQVETGRRFDLLHGGDPLGLVLVARLVLRLPQLFLQHVVEALENVDALLVVVELSLTHRSQLRNLLGIVFCLFENGGGQAGDLYYSICFAQMKRVAGETKMRPLDFCIGDRIND